MPAVQKIGFTVAALMTAALAIPARGSDAVRGALLYKECAGCHAPLTIQNGPPHCGVFGRKSASVEGFAYSDVMREAGFVWDEQHLHEFLTFPISYLPGTKMGFAGMFDEADRNDVIAFLKAERAADSPACAATAEAAGTPPVAATQGAR